MAIRNRTQKLLSILLPVGVLGVSAALASASVPSATATDQPAATHDLDKLSIADRLQAIRSSVSSLDTVDFDDPNITLAQWANFNGGGVGWRNAGPWRNGGWRNAGPWRNAGWGNGPWRNGGWGNGGWRNNWGNGGWHNFWHNW